MITLKSKSDVVRFIIAVAVLLFISFVLVTSSHGQTKVISNSGEVQGTLTKSDGLKVVIIDTDVINPNLVTYKYLRVADPCQHKRPDTVEDKTGCYHYDYSMVNATVDLDKLVSLSVKLGTREVTFDANDIMTALEGRNGQ